MPHLRGLGVSEKGMADNLYIRYLDRAEIEVQRDGGSRVIAVGGSFYIWADTHWKQDDAEVRRYIAHLPQILAIEKEQIIKLIALMRPFSIVNVEKLNPCPSIHCNA